MWTRTARILAGLFVVLFLASVVFFTAMRSKFPPVLSAVRRFNRSVANPNAMKTAGQSGAYASVIHHVGRTTGAEYETPIVPYMTDDGFVIPLPYGTTPDWLKNVQRSGEATITSDGETYPVSHPQIISGDEAMPSISVKEQRSLRWFNIDEDLRVSGMASSDAEF
jgi:deazaflavin-dependent oxidoreductase (nitroreductase family)